MDCELGEDLYADLDNDTITNPEGPLPAELEANLEKLNSILGQFKSDNKKLLQENKILKRNLEALLKTATLEIKRKDREIEALRKSARAAKTGQNDRIHSTSQITNSSEPIKLEPVSEQHELSEMLCCEPTSVVPTRNSARRTNERVARSHPEEAVNIKKESHQINDSTRVSPGKSGTGKNPDKQCVKSHVKVEKLPPYKGNNQENHCNKQSVKDRPGKTADVSLKKEKSGMGLRRGNESDHSRESGGVHERLIKLANATEECDEKLVKRSHEGRDYFHDDRGRRRDYDSRNRRFRENLSRERREDRQRRSRSRSAGRYQRRCRNGSQSPGDRRSRGGYGRHRSRSPCDSRYRRPLRRMGDRSLERGRREYQDGNSRSNTPVHLGHNHAVCKPEPSIPDDYREQDDFGGILQSGTDVETEGERYDLHLGQPEFSTDEIYQSEERESGKEDGERSDSDTFEDAVDEQPNTDWQKSFSNHRVRNRPVKTLFTIRMEQKLKRELAMESAQRDSDVVENVSGTDEKSPSNDLGNETSQPSSDEFSNKLPISCQSGRQSSSEEVTQHETQAENQEKSPPIDSAEHIVTPMETQFAPIETEMEEGEIDEREEPLSKPEHHLGKKGLKPTVQDNENVTENGELTKEVDSPHKEDEPAHKFIMQKPSKPLHPSDIFVTDGVSSSVIAISSNQSAIEPLNKCVSASNNLPAANSQVDLKQPPKPSFDLFCYKIPKKKTGEKNESVNVLDMVSSDNIIMSNRNGEQDIRKKNGTEKIEKGDSIPSQTVRKSGDCHERKRRSGNEVPETSKKTNTKRHGKSDGARDTLDRRKRTKSNEKPEIRKKRSSEKVVKGSSCDDVLPEINKNTRRRTNSNDESEASRKNNTIKNNCQSDGVSSNEKRAKNDGKSKEKKLAIILSKCDSVNGKLTTKKEAEKRKADRISDGAKTNAENRKNTTEKTDHSEARSKERSRKMEPEKLKGASNITAKGSQSTVISSKTEKTKDDTKSGSKPTPLKMTEFCEKAEINKMQNVETASPNVEMKTVPSEPCEASGEATSRVLVEMDKMVDSEIADLLNIMESPMEGTTSLASNVITLHGSWDDTPPAPATLSDPTTRFPDHSVETDGLASSSIENYQMFKNMSSEPSDGSLGRDLHLSDSEPEEEKEDEEPEMSASSDEYDSDASDIVSKFF